jgi:hypothetical protein
MPYAPGIQDRSGEIFAAGIMNAAQNISRGIYDYRAEKQKKDEESAAVEYIMKNGANLGINTADDKEVKAVIKTAGGGREAVTMLAGMAQLQEQQAAARREEEQQKRNAAALQVALSGQGGMSVVPSTMQGGRTPAAMVQRYTGMGGELTPDVARLLIGSAEKPGQPMPGSSGYKTVQIPGLGDVVVDTATGEPLDSGKVIRPKETPPPKSLDTGVEYSPDKQFYRSGPGDEWHPVADKKNDAKALTATELQQIQALSQSARDLDALEAAYGELGPDWGGPVGGRALGLDPTDPNVSRIDSLVTGATPNLARGVFREVGVLTDDDVKRYQKLLPSRNDTAAQRTQKLKDLRARLQLSREETLKTLKAAGRDVDGLQEMLGSVAPAAADATPAGRRDIAGITQVTSQAEFDALPPGAKFSFNGRFGIKK